VETIVTFLPYRHSDTANVRRCDDTRTNTRPDVRVSCIKYMHDTRHANLPVAKTPKSAARHTYHERIRIFISVITEGTTFLPSFLVPPEVWIKRTLFIDSTLGRITGRLPN
jgi:hypothetical protein